MLTFWANKTYQLKNNKSYRSSSNNGNFIKKREESLSTLPDFLFDDSGD